MKSQSFLEPLRDFDISISTIKNILVPSKTAGPGGIPPILVKKCAKSHSKSHCQNFGKIKQTGVYPTVWKYATVIPTFKKGSKSDFENYRFLTRYRNNALCLRYSNVFFSTSYTNVCSLSSVPLNLISEKGDDALFRWSLKWKSFTMPTNLVKISTSFTQNMRKYSIKCTTGYC